MDQRLFLVHGIRAKDKGAKSMGKLATELSHSFDRVHTVSYGYVLIPINNKKAVTAIIKSLEKNRTKDSDNVIVAYSNGCWAAVQVAEMGYKVDHLVLISPALHRSHAIPEQVKRVDIYYSKGDRVVELGRVWRSIVNILPWNWKGYGKPHNWGSMGRYGYQGNDERIHNHHMGEDVGHFWYKSRLLVKSIAVNVTSIYKRKHK